MATTTGDPTKHHPAQFSSEVLDEIGKILADHWGWPPYVHDPFAGTGVRLGRLCDKLGLGFTGSEIEPEFIVDARVARGDSTEPNSYPNRPFVIVTSPVYPNGMADHFRAQDDSERHTYRQGLANITGTDRVLHVNNMGRYTARAGNKALRLHLEIAVKAAWLWWPSPAVVNVSDFIVAGEPFSLVDRWHRLLMKVGYRIASDTPVKTRRQRKGANGDARVEFEHVLVALADPNSPVRLGHADMPEVL